MGGGERKSGKDVRVWMSKSDILVLQRIKEMLTIQIARCPSETPRFRIIFRIISRTDRAAQPRIALAFRAPPVCPVKSSPITRAGPLAIKVTLK